MHRFLLVMYLLIFILFIVPVKAWGILLTGQLQANDSQTFYSPKTDSWQVQVQWIFPEGKVAQKGDLVVVFDSGDIQTRLDQEKVNLIDAEEELSRIMNIGEHEILTASYGVKKEQLRLEKARLYADIPQKHLSNYDYEKNQLIENEQRVAYVQAQDLLKQAEVAHAAAIAKQKLIIARHQDILVYWQRKLDKMSLYAKRSGPVLYAYHPWNGEKVFVGMIAQSAWAIAEIPSLNELYIEAWVHEIDYNQLKIGQTLQLTFDAFPEIKLEATTSELSTQPQERKEWGSDAYFRAAFTFSDNEQLPLLPGMSAQLELAPNAIQ
ncbi:HlyD family efflux transporter periplasmic adaptor subunit [Thalassomonas viridans]|uniref:HlyD family efflux transporter periplasmic adaptor subunit n=1 Tax=Thalassomonas viridans TaxID=137584 RepID=A0AAF0CE87_9GAMM|nr:HlyD family efflux transporter periplasmic adaptor subunit [Thalassomonas viridans]WDE08624.1 HlyD family efflux transporter periplasmic adaptor subunit [Thalassomonas viridans]